MNEKYLIGLDAGTTSIKGILISRDGHIVATAGQEYLLDSHNDRCELDPEIYWQTTVQILRSLLAHVPGRDIAALSFSSQGETLIAVDRNGRPLRKAIVWLDNRSTAEAAQIEQEFGLDRILAVTGLPEVLPLWPATKIVWLQKNEPHVFNQVHKYLLVHDYLIYKLTGQYVSEHSLLSSTLCFDIVKKTWWKEMLDYMHITPDQLPAISPAAHLIAPVQKKIAQEIGLNPDTMVVTGAYDHTAGAIGAGNIEVGVTTETTGAAMAMVVTLDQPILDPGLKLPCQCHCLPDKYFLMPYGQTAGMALKWFKDTFCREEVIQAEKTGRDVYEILTESAAAVAPGAEGLTMLPHLMGAGSPEFNPRATAVFCGMRMGMGKGHFVRALLESVACMVQKNIRMLPQHIVIKEIRALGGGARSDLWNQIKADLTGIPIVTLDYPETPALGAAILAGVGSGVFADVIQGCSRIVKIKKRYVPNPELAQFYSSVYERYNSLYDHLLPFWQKGE
jgi:xylulokinase